MEALVFCFEHRGNGGTAAKENALDVDGLSQIPNFFFGIQNTIVFGMHDASIIEHDIDTTPRFNKFDKGIDLICLRNVANLVFNLCSRRLDDIASIDSDLFKSLLRPSSLISEMRTLAPSRAN